MKKWLLFLTLLCIVGCSDSEPLQDETRPNLDVNLTMDNDENQENNITIDVDFPPQPAGD